MTPLPSPPLAHRQKAGNISPEDGAALVIGFWFDDAARKNWFRKSAHFDGHIAANFAGAHEAAIAGDLDHWMTSPTSALALVILLDQFSRNLHRDSAVAFAADPKARIVAKAAIDQEFDLGMKIPQRAFLYMPFMHSEEGDDQKRSLALYAPLAPEWDFAHAEVHADIINKFGRFPHRNDVLGRLSTAAEIEFLQNGGFKG